MTENSYVHMLFYSSLDYLPLIIIIYLNIEAVRKFRFPHKILTLVLLVMYMITCILQKPQFYSYLDTFVFSFINLFVVAGIEELFYRGILFTEFKNEKGVYFAYTVSTILFIVGKCIYASRGFYGFSIFNYHHNYDIMVHVYL